MTTLILGDNKHVHWPHFFFHATSHLSRNRLLNIFSISQEMHRIAFSIVTISISCWCLSRLVDLFIYYFYNFYKCFLYCVCFLKSVLIIYVSRQNNRNYDIVETGFYTKKSTKFKLYNELFNIKSSHHLLKIYWEKNHVHII